MLIMKNSMLKTLGMADFVASFRSLTSLVQSLQANSEINNLTRLQDSIAYQSTVMEITQLNEVFDKFMVDAIEKKKKEFKVLKDFSTKEYLSIFEYQNSINTLLSDYNTIATQDIFDTVSNFNLELKYMEKLIQSNLRLFMDVDWSTALGPEYSELNDVEITEDDIKIDLSNPLSLQQKLATWFDKFKDENPIIVLFLEYFLVPLIISIIVTSANGMIQNKSEGIVLENRNANQQIIKKKLVLEVNQTLDITIESSLVKDEIFRVYAFIAI